MKLTVLVCVFSERGAKPVTNFMRNLSALSSWHSVYTSAIAFIVSTAHHPHKPLKHDSSLFMYSLPVQSVYFTTIIKTNKAHCRLHITRLGKAPPQVKLICYMV